MKLFASMSPSLNKHLYRSSDYRFPTKQRNWIGSTCELHRAGKEREKYIYSFIDI